MYDDDEEPPPLGERKVRRTRIAIALSVALHLLCAALVFESLPFFKKFEPKEKNEVAVTEQILRIEKPVATPKPTPEPTPAPPPPSRVITSVPPQQLAPRPELEKIVPKATPQPLHADNGTVKKAPRAKVHAPALSDQRIAQIQSDLSSAIAQDRNGLNPLGHVPAGAPPEMKRYDMDFGAVAAGTTGIRHAHGMCDPVQSWKDDGWDYYYVACNVHLSDGSFERQGVPWPVRFNPRDDPFNGTARDDIPLSMPLPGWHLGEGQTISSELREYAREHGVEI
jgi:type IV secretory pathway VirB10-like protein